MTRYLRPATAVAVYLAVWWFVRALPPDAMGRQIAPLAFIAFVGALTVTAYFVTRNAPVWLRIAATLAAGPVAAACASRPAEPAFASLLGLGLVMALAPIIAFGADAARSACDNASS